MCLTSSISSLLSSLVFLSIFALHYCTPQGYYYNGYSPYRADTYPRAIASAHHRNSYYNNNNYYGDYNKSRSPTKAPSIGAHSNHTPQKPIPGQNRVSRADAENAKFAGANNLEDDVESSRTALLLKKKLLKKRLFRQFASRRCYPYGRDAQQVPTTPVPREQGRFLWDLSVVNVYPGGGFQQPPISGCRDFYGGYGNSYGGFGGGLGGGLASLASGLLSDPIEPAYPAVSPYNFLSWFAPGILQNALAATAPPLPQPPPPPVQSDTTGSANEELDDLQSDPAVDPTYRPPTIPHRRPNNVYFDSAGAAPLTPGQLVGSVATTVNGIIQQLTGNVRPVYQSPYRRSASYG